MKYGKSKTQHILSGTYRPNRHEKKPVGIHLENIQPVFSLPEYAQAFFDDVTGELNSKGLLRSEDMALYTHLAAQAQIIKDTFEHINQEGYTTIGSTGNKVPSPAYTIFRATTKDFSDQCVKLGIGMAGRIRMHLEDRINDEAGQPKIDLN